MYDHMISVTHAHMINLSHGSSAHMNMYREREHISCEDEHVCHHFHVTVYFFVLSSLFPSPPLSSLSPFLPPFPLSFPIFPFPISTFLPLTQGQSISTLRIPMEQIADLQQEPLGEYQRMDSNTSIRKRGTSRGAPPDYEGSLPVWYHYTDGLSYDFPSLSSFSFS